MCVTTPSRTARTLVRRARQCPGPRENGVIDPPAAPRSRRVSNGPSCGANATVRGAAAAPPERWFEHGDAQRPAAQEPNECGGSSRSRCRRRPSCLRRPHIQPDLGRASAPQPWATPSIRRPRRRRPNRRRRQIVAARRRRVRGVGCLSPDEPMMLDGSDAAIGGDWRMATLQIGNVELRADLPRRRTVSRRMLRRDHRPGRESRCRLSC